MHGESLRKRTMELPIPATLKANCRRAFEREAWLELLPDRVRELEHRWSLRIHAAFSDVSCAWVAPVTHLFNCTTRLLSDPEGIIRRIAELTMLAQERVRLWIFARAAADPRADWSEDSLTLARAIARTLS